MQNVVRIPGSNLPAVSGLNPGSYVTLTWYTPLYEMKILRFKQSTISQRIGFILNKGIVKTPGHLAR
jgi:hypothetical protein